MGIYNLKSYKELEAYKKSFALVKDVYSITKSFPREELYSLTSQIRRSAVSIPSNIAEGYMRGSKEYAQFLKIALGSCAELETQLLLSLDIGLCKDKDIMPSLGRLEETARLINSYIKGLSSRYSLNPNPCTLKTKPYTLDPKP